MKVKLMNSKDSFIKRVNDLGDLDWKLAWQGIGTLRPKTLDISTWDKGPDRIKKVFSIFDSSLCESNADMEYMKKTLAQVTLKVK